MISQLALFGKWYRVLCTLYLQLNENFPPFTDRKLHLTFKPLTKYATGSIMHMRKERAFMGFKVRIEIDPQCDEEIIVRCRNMSADVARIESLISSLDSSEMELELGDKIHFVKVSSILFFETDGSKTAAHTADRMYYTDLKLYELEERLPNSFMRISKSCIINVKAVSSIHKEITGICEAFFRNTQKKVYVSRGYYKSFKEKINETRLK